MARKYPIGLQNFRKIREGGYVYVDKTEIIHRLVSTGSYYFLSRPRRFGKSLLVDTIEELFSGSRDLFKGLWIGNQWDWTQKNPVLHLRLSSIPYKQVGLHEALFMELDVLAEPLAIKLVATDLQTKFRELIEKTAKQWGKVVILIDEYDKPIIDFLDDPEKVDENRSVFKQFYSVLKDADAYIRFLLLTGVSRFSKVSVFSDLNNLRDITFSNPFNAIAGITQQELERDFSEELSGLATGNPNILDDIRNWYNGYAWSGNQTLYNPFSLLNFMADPAFRNYWYTTGTPTFLLKELKRQGLSDMDGVTASANQLSEFDTNRLDMASLLFQTGYLTIQEAIVPDQYYKLGYPNREVRESFLEGLLNVYREYPAKSNSYGLSLDLKTAMQLNDVPAMIRALDALIGVIPYEHWKVEKESIFTIITTLAFKLAGAEVHSEVHHAKGRCDVLAKTDRHIFIIEVKLDGTAEEALQQIIDRNYLQPYQDDRRKKIALGISFSSEARKVAGYLTEEIS